MIKTHYSVAELRTFGLPLLPKSDRGIELKVGREGWSHVEVKAKGGRGGIRREYQPPATVMAAIKQIVLDRTLKQAPASMAAVIPSTSSLPAGGALTTPCHAITTAIQAGALKDWQKRTAEARVALLQEIDRIAEIVGREKAIQKVVIMAQDGTLPDHLTQLVPIANARSGADGKRTLSRRTIYEWLKAYQPGNAHAVNALAPKDQHAVTTVPAWATDLLAQYQTPQKPSLAWAVERIAAKHGIDQENLYHRARRFLQKVGNVELQAGRMGSRDIKNIKPFVRRDTAMLWPSDIYTADGHTFDAEIAHPAHGKPFRPEITTVVDVATRRFVGWSIDLAESGLAVLDALRHACETGGIPTTFYVDNGSGYKNALMSQPGVGMSARLGFQMSHSIAYNSQARGIEERSHRSALVRAAKELPTYIGADMDRQAMQKIHKVTRLDIKNSGHSKYLMPFRYFVAFIEEQLTKFNDKPHRGLPKVFDDALGRLRHMSPNEAWAKGVQDGAELVLVDATESRDLFRPQREVKVLRGEIKLFGNLYFAHELTEYHGDVVRAAFDVHNAGQIWVYDQQGRFICNAGFEANKRDYMPESFLEQGARKRADGRIRRLEARLDEVHLEQTGTPLREVFDRPALEHNPASTLQQLVGTPNTQREKVAANLDSAAAVEDSLDDFMSPAPGNEQARPIFMIDSDRYEWLMKHKDQWTDADHHFLTQFVVSDIYEALRERFEALDIAWRAGDGDVFKVAV